MSKLLIKRIFRLIVLELYKKKVKILEKSAIISNF